MRSGGEVGGPLARHHRLLRSIWRDFPWLAECLWMDADDGTLNRRDRVPVHLRRVRDQYRWFRRTFPGDALFMQVGRYIEFYQPDEQALSASLGLNPLRPNRRGARWGFPLRQFSGHLIRLLQQGRGVILVGETGRRLERVEARAPQWRFVPLGPS